VELGKLGNMSPRVLRNVARDRGGERVAQVEKKKGFAEVKFHAQSSRLKVEIVKLNAKYKSSKVKAERSRLKGANLERSESLGAIHLFGNVKENCLLG
jgi:hypothetical protein